MDIMASSWMMRLIFVDFSTLLVLLCLLLGVTSASAADIATSTDWSAPSSTVGLPVVCPAQCDCFNYHETVDCSRRDLTQVPVSLPSVVRRLYVEGNHIEDLGDGRLSAAVNLSVLIVEDNQLTELNVDALCPVFCPLYSRVQRFAGTLHAVSSPILFRGVLFSGLS